MVQNMKITRKLFNMALLTRSFISGIFLSAFLISSSNHATALDLDVPYVESPDEIVEVMKDLRSHKVDMITLGQYLQPTEFHLPVARYVSPNEFESLKVVGEGLGFESVASGPMVRSSYHADLQAQGKAII